MKYLLYALILIPFLSFGQVKVEVTEKQSYNPYNASIKAQEQASKEILDYQKARAKAQAEAIKARAAATKANAVRAAAMNEPQVDIKTPLQVDLSNYSHIALINVTYCSDLGVQSSDISTYTSMESTLGDSPLGILNPYRVDKRRAKKNRRFLKETKNPKWLYFYYIKSIQGVDEIRKIIVRDFENKIIYNVVTRNTPFNQTVEPLVFF